ncbi:MAG: bifunctional YncE family protein/alkaline phosphatase family protein [Bryobacterales bacterium]|nr:bifunctional YncE family protein/alkaline phosphatase family protein [Bryobacterales bacterium]
MRTRAGVLILVLTAALFSQAGPYRLPNGWRVERAPAGRPGRDVLPLAAVLSPDGRRVLTLTCGFEPPAVEVLDAATHESLSRTPVAAAGGSAGDAWLGLAFSPKGDRVYVGGGADASVFEFSFDGVKLSPARVFPVVEPARRTGRDFAGDIAFSPDGRLLYVAELYQNSIAVINPQSGRVIDRFKTGRRPYRILFHPDGKSFFVSLWADGMVLRHETETGKLAGKFLLALHPTDMVWVAGRPKSVTENEAPSPYVARIFIAASGTNSVRVLGETEAGDIRQTESVNLALTPLQPAGMTPSALAYDAARSRLYVACSDENAVAVLDVSRAQSQILGYIPAGRYPTAVRVLPGGRLMVLTAGGAAAYLEPPTAEELDARTQTVRERSAYRDDKLRDAGTGPDNPVPSWPGDPTPIQHVVYVLVDEGWTYDQVFGDLPRGKGDATLARFGEAATPNLHRLAREHVLLDDFLVIGEGLGDGYNWSVAAIAPSYVRRLWPGSAAGRRRWNDFAESEPAAIPPAGYLWTNAAAAGVSFGGYAADRPSMDQAAAFLRDLAGYEKSGKLPRLVFLRFTSRTAADNDRAFGALVTGLSKSSYWPRTAVFLAVAHTAGGTDHVDPQRAPAMVISPHAKRGVVDSTRYNTASLLRTIELILGLQPMTQFDAAATPMAACFQPKPVGAPAGGSGR